LEYSGHYRNLRTTNVYGVSSAKIIDLTGFLLMFGRLLIAVWNKKMLRWEPWGTPFSNINVFDIWHLIFTWKNRWFKKLVRKINIFPCMFQFLSKLINLYRQTVSYAFCKSRFMRIIDGLLVRFSMTLVSIFTWQSVVEWCFLKPCWHGEWNLCWIAYQFSQL